MKSYKSNRSATQPFFQCSEMWLLFAIESLILTNLLSLSTGTKGYAGVYGGWCFYLASKNWVYIARWQSRGLEKVNKRCIVTKFLDSLTSEGKLFPVVLPSGRNACMKRTLTNSCFTSYLHKASSSILAFSLGSYGRKTRLYSYSRWS